MKEISKLSITFKLPGPGVLSKNLTGDWRGGAAGRFSLPAKMVVCTVCCLPLLMMQMNLCQNLCEDLEMDRLSYGGINMEIGQ